MLVQQHAWASNLDGLFRSPGREQPISQGTDVEDRLCSTWSLANQFIIQLITVCSRRRKKRRSGCCFSFESKP